MTPRRIWLLAFLAPALLGLTRLESGPRVAAQSASAHRPAEAITLTGADLEPFVGASEAELWAWSWRDGSWRLLAAQLDERDAQGAYVAEEDGLLDANDELVLMLDDAGAPPPGGQRPPAMPFDAPRARIAIGDPLDPDYAAEIQLLRSIVGPEIAIQPRIRWDAAARELVSAEYRLGPADAATDGFMGVRSLSLGEDGTDLVDRLKIRGKLEAFGSVTEVNEESLGVLLAAAGLSLSGEPLKVGPLRALLGAGGGYAYDRRFSLFGGADALADVGVGPIAFSFTDARISLDFSPAVAGASYHDANLPAGVTVDASPDAVPESPPPAWRELRLPGARISLLARAVAPDSSARAYYRDAVDGGPGDTGDGMAYADLGVTAPDFESLAATGFPGELLILPAGADPAPEQLLDWRAAPVELGLSFDGVPPTATPGPGPSATLAPPATATPGSETTPTTPAGGSARIYLPYAAHP
ncbi:MAG: hypothetical protein KDH92_00245 [Chloroflexi bacterium]|nr:hypothetical protein [Chloroflexota bacterium]